MKWKQLFLIVALSATTAIGSVWTYNKFFNNSPVVGSSEKGLPVNYAGFFDGKSSPSEAIDFTNAANAAVPAVVHIKTKVAAKKLSNDIPRRRGMFDDWVEDFFGYGPNIIPEQRASGSGVLISEDGYIVTNNHVITGGANAVAEEITVTMHNRKRYNAKVIGRDPSSDIAVLKIDGGKFPFLLYGNSNNMQLGQWVLAVGYPLNLETTVTAGIVSATGRSININRRQISDNTSAVESFIQTDAAVNQGNSGGALVTTKGELIGINSAILAPNGTYAGYSFAIPVHIVKKIVDDIIRFGDVQRGYLGISYPTSAEGASEEELRQQGIPTNVEGVYVSEVSPDGGAFAAGIRKGDLITKVNNAQVISGIQMSAQLASFRPGDRVPITYYRNGKEYTAEITLRKKPGTFTEVAAVNVGTKLGAELITVDKDKARTYGIAGGVMVRKIREGGPISRTRMGEGFIITSANGQNITNVEDLNKVLSKTTGPVKVEGVYPGGESVYPYVISLD